MDEAGKLLCYNTTRKLVVQYKHFLDMLRHLQEDEAKCIENLEESAGDAQEMLDEYSIPVSVKSYLHQVENLHDEKVSRLRKEVLDLGNNLVREIESEFEKYNITL